MTGKGGCTYPPKPTKTITSILAVMLPVLFILATVAPAYASWYAQWELSDSGGTYIPNARGGQTYMTPVTNSYTTYPNPSNSRISQWIAIINDTNGEQAQAGWYNGSAIAGASDSNCAAETTYMRLFQEYHTNTATNYCWQLGTTSTSGKTYTVQNTGLYGPGQWIYTADVDGVSTYSIILHFPYGRVDAGLESIDSSSNRAKATFDSLKYIKRDVSGWVDWPYRITLCTSPLYYFTTWLTQWTKMEAKAGSTTFCL